MHCLLYIFLNFRAIQSLFSDTLKIKGTANILSSANDPNSPFGNSTYSWSLYTTWPGPDGGYVYQVEIPITNLDGDIQLWEVSFDVPDGCIVTESEIWQASKVTVTGNTVNLVGRDWNGFVQNGAQLGLNLILPFSAPVENFNISNVILNGKAVHYVPETT